MALWEVTNLDKGKELTSIIHTEGSLKLDGDYGNKVMVKRFTYSHKHPLYPPSIMNARGKMFIVPGFIPVHEKTTLKDIIWDKPKEKPKTKIIKKIFKSSSGSGTYIAKKYINDDGSVKITCNCMGQYRAKDRRCKHIKEMEKL